jgi:hypothetical protein
MAADAETSVPVPVLVAEQRPPQADDAAAAAAAAARAAAAASASAAALEEFTAAYDQVETFGRNAGISGSAFSSVAFGGTHPMLAVAGRALALRVADDRANPLFTRYEDLRAAARIAHAHVSKAVRLCVSDDLRTALRLAYITACVSWALDPANWISMNAGSTYLTAADPQYHFRRPADAIVVGFDAGDGPVIDWITNVADGTVAALVAVDYYCLGAWCELGCLWEYINQPKRPEVPARGFARMTAALVAFRAAVGADLFDDRLAVNREIYADDVTAERGADAHDVAQT